ncbi:hypothetical protein [Haladaptatus halobius]|uniref:hypothetical protein n=1 Tax=Haladaptatus halobius TaxID=2884875 RepID=UPI001D0AD06B|nr:hypothetical protein [Haladaptatus halobius]
MSDGSRFGNDTANPDGAMNATALVEGHRHGSGSTSAENRSSSNDRCSFLVHYPKIRM